MITRKALYNTFKKALNTSTLSTLIVDVDHKLSHSYDGVITISPQSDYIIDIDQKVKPKEMVQQFKERIVSKIEESVMFSYEAGKTTILAKPFLENDYSLGHSIDDVIRNNHFANFDEIVLNNGLVVLVMIKEQYRDEVTHCITDEHVETFKKMREDGASLEAMKEEYIKQVKAPADKLTTQVLESYILDFAIFMR